MQQVPRGSVWKHAKMNAWVVDCRDGQGRRHVIKAGNSKTIALATLSARLQQLAVDGLSGQHGIADKSFNEVATEYLNNARATKRSWGRDETSLKHLRAAFGDKLLSNITVKDVEDYKTARSQVRTPATVNRELACLKHLFNKAIEWDFARENPVKRVKLFKENNQRVRFLDPPERKRLLAFCSTQLRPVVLVALNTGLRLGELLSLTWADIDMTRKLIHVRDSKSGEGRYVPLNAEAEQALAGLSKHIESARVFFNRDGKPYNSVRTAFTNACRGAGVKDFRFHDLRHTFASSLVMSGIDLNTVRELMGHKSITMTLRYAHLAPQHKQAAVDKLADFWHTQGAKKSKKSVNR